MNEQILTSRKEKRKRMVMIQDEALVVENKRKEAIEMEHKEEMVFKEQGENTNASVPTH